MKRILSYATVFLFVFGGFGCASVSKNKTDEQVVAERAQLWADGLLSHEFEKSWLYTTPTFRTTTTPAGYKKWVGGAYTWTDAEVASVTCQEARCDVDMSIGYSLPRLKLKNTRSIQYTWIKVDDQWWIFHR